MCNFIFIFVLYHFLIKFIVLMYIIYLIIHIRTKFFETRIQNTSYIMTLVYTLNSEGDSWWEWRLLPERNKDDNITLVSNHRLHTWVVCDIFWNNESKEKDPYSRTKFRKVCVSKECSTQFRSSVLQAACIKDICIRIRNFVKICKQHPQHVMHQI